MKRIVRSKWSGIILLLIMFLSTIFMVVFRNIGIFGLITVMSAILSYVRNSLIEYWNLLDKAEI